MRNGQEGGAGAYAISTRVRGDRTYAVVVSAADLHIVCWCADEAEARAIAHRLNARVPRATPQRLVVPHMRRRAG